MDKGLEDKLFNKYSKLFAQRNMSMQETCMCWGIDTGNGWYILLDNLCDCIQSYIDCNKKEQVEFTQVKEKFGQLCVYSNKTNNLVQGMIWLAEHMSYGICENCGSMSNIIHTQGWVKTLCRRCNEDN